MLQAKWLLLDLKLPRVDGLEILRQIKSDGRTKVVPVAFPMVWLNWDSRSESLCTHIPFSRYLTRCNTLSY